MNPQILLGEICTNCFCLTKDHFGNKCYGDKSIKISENKSIFRTCPCAKLQLTVGIKTKIIQRFEVKSVENQIRTCANCGCDIQNHEFRNEVSGAGKCINPYCPIDCEEFEIIELLIYK